MSRSEKMRLCALCDTAFDMNLGKISAKKFLNLRVETDSGHHRVKVALYSGPTLLKSTSTKFPKKNSHCMHCIHCFNCSFSTFLCAKLCANFYTTTRHEILIFDGGNRV